LSVLYKDLNQFSPTDREFSENARAIYQSVFNIITTRKGERLFNPEFGVNLEDELFELNDTVSQESIKDAIATGISVFEPRVSIDRAQTQIFIDEDNHKIEVSIVFSIEGLGDQTFQIIENITR
jgi:phage baseplate assembly protein W